MNQTRRLANRLMALSKLFLYTGLKFNFLKPFHLVTSVLFQLNLSLVSLDRKNYNKMTTTFTFDQFLYFSCLLDS